MFFEFHFNVVLILSFADFVCFFQAPLTVQQVGGWVDTLEAVYNGIGGCTSYIFLLRCFCLMLLTLDLVAGRFRHHLKNIDYFKLL